MTTLDEVRVKFLELRNEYRLLGERPFRKAPPKYQLRKDFDIPQFASLYDHLVRSPDLVNDPAWAVARQAKLWMMWLNEGKSAALLWKLQEVR